MYKNLLNALKMNKSDKTALLLFVLLLGVALGVVIYGLERVMKYKSRNKQAVPAEQTDTVQPIILYEDIWDKAMPLKEEDL